MTLSKLTNSLCSFLKLPSELRNHIYAYLISPLKVIDQQHLHKRNINKRQTYNFGQPIWPLSHVCWQLYCETAVLELSRSIMRNNDFTEVMHVADTCHGKYIHRIIIRIHRSEEGTNALFGPGIILTLQQLFPAVHEITLEACRASKRVSHT